MLRLEAITLSAGGTELLSGVDWHVHPGEKVGLVGRNGTGKTSLLRAVAGELPVDEGRVRLRGDAVLGWLRQTGVSGSRLTVWEEAKQGLSRLVALQEELEAAQRAVEQRVDGAVERFADLDDRFRLAGGYAMEERIGEVLHGLGFDKEAWRRTCDTFSGGWQMRIALARLLLSEPTLLLLDEPTNHLDLRARTWLAGYLARYPHTVIVVSHDRYLLDRVTTRIAEVRSGSLLHYTGNFSAYVSQREERIEQEQAAFEAQQDEIRRLERFVERFKAKATKASQARSRQKQLDKMERLDAPRREPMPRLRLPPSPVAAPDPIGLRGAAFGWPDGPDVLADVDLELHRGMRVAVLGPNGCGKSTLLHALAARLPLRQGKRDLARGVRVGVFDQDLAQALPQDLRAVDHVSAEAPMAPTARVRAALGALGLTGEQALQEIGSLSGGEKARVALATFAVKPFDVLLLDEPTNHLDAVTVHVLVEALRAYDGTVVLVTHDRYLVETLATHVLRVEDGTAVLSEGVRPEDLEPVPSSSAGSAEGKESPGAEAYAERKRRARERDRAQRRIEVIQEEIEELDAEMARLEAAMAEAAADWERSQALEDDRRSLAARSEALFAEWEGFEQEG